MEISREKLSFMREQFPQGTRIRLMEMDDPYSPVEPGTEGSLEQIDDVGTFHIKWDNGRTLSLIPGEDRFDVLPPELTMLKLYMPLTADCYEYDEWGASSEISTELDGNDLEGYADIILSALQNNRDPDVMHFYDQRDSVHDKVQSAVFTAEVRDEQLWGVVECRVLGSLTAKELDALTEYLTGQAADGWGEVFEQHKIDVELYVHFWNKNPSWSIQTEQEQFQPRFEGSMQMG